METPLEKILTHAYKEEMISFMHSHPEYFAEAVDLAIADKQPYSWRAAWLLWSCMEENDKRLKKHVKKIILSIPAKKDGQQRELLKILLNMKLNDGHEGYLFDICVGIWEQPSKRPSVRYTAFMYLFTMAKKHPDLWNEMAFLTDTIYLESLSPGIRHAIVKMKNEFLPR